jgi:hypothetical protein
METNKNKLSKSTADLNIKNLDPSILGFISAEYTEITSGVLPRLVADFICNIDSYPLSITEVDLELRIEDNIWDLKANVDDFKFSKNVLTLFFTLAPKEFYFVSRSEKFKSASEVIKTLYFGDIESDINDNRLVELNQVATTDYKFLNNILKSYKSPSVFAYTLNSLNIHNLDTSGYKVSIDPKYLSYYVDDREKTYTNDSLLESTPTAIGVMQTNGAESSSLLEWGGIKLTYNHELSDLVDNVVSNTISLKGHKLSLRLTSQKNMEFKSGDIVNIDIPEIDINRFIVMQRMIIIGPEIKFNYKLKGIE